MLGQQIRAWEVLDDRVLRALEQTPRERFVPEEYRDLAFADTEIPLAHGQSMLAPKIEGRLLQALQIEPIEEVLEVGTGTGFLTAVLARLAQRVLSVDIFPEFVAAARTKLAAENMRNVELRTADVLSLELAGRFDAIAITASVPELDDYFVRMLRPRGRLFVVVGRAPAMEARLITLNANGDSTSESLFETVLTPLINAERPEPFVL
jgi:protein-L-isoaspartate(D-aspartate) O-methyltransferase